MNSTGARSAAWGAPPRPAREYRCRRITVGELDLMKEGQRAAAIKNEDGAHRNTLSMSHFPPPLSGNMISDQYRARV